MLRLNLISLMLSLVLTFVTTIVLNSLNLAILSIVLVLMFRSYLAEIYLAKLLKISVFKDSLLELIMTIIFITTAWFGEMWVSMSFYVIMYCIYLIIKKKDISRMICNLKLLMQIN